MLISEALCGNIFTEGWVTTKHTEKSEEEHSYAHFEMCLYISLINLGLCFLSDVQWKTSVFLTW